MRARVKRSCHDVAVTTALEARERERKRGRGVQLILRLQLPKPCTVE